ncbi:MAG: hypothetical protein LBF15_02715 [Candidatus Peribacteria bacterium]|jgi:hypothetical protein|nr:hypothetical protein [Candidatus Peribacteria bacterium]
MLLPMLRMMSFKSDTDLLNETILEVSRKLSDVKEKPEIYTKAKKIFGNLKKVPPSEKDKIDEAEKFYNEY